MDPKRPRHDPLTVVMVALLAYVIADVLHEGVGHGGACLLVGGRPLVVSTVHFDCDSRAVGAWGERFIAAAGTLVNFCAGALALLTLRHARWTSGASAWFLWIFMTVNLLQGTGYFLFSGVSGIGDWAAVTQGLRPAWVGRVALIALGALTYWLAVVRAVRELGPFLSGAAAERVRSGVHLTVPAYVAGGLLSCLAGLLNPVGMVLVAISAAAASFGGTSGLAWMPQLLHGRSDASTTEPTLVISRAPAWIVGGSVAAAVFVLMLGPGLRLGPL